MAEAATKAGVVRRVAIPLRRAIRVRLQVLTAPAKQRPQRSIPSRRSAAIAVTVGLACFFAAALGLGWAVHTERSPLRDPIYFDKLAKLRQHRAFFPATSAAGPNTVLFIGSSRTLNAVDARAAQAKLSHELGRPVETFNFGQAGAGPVTNAIYLRRLLKEGVKPEFAVIEVHPTFLAGQRPDPPETRWLLPIRLRPEEMPVVRDGIPGQVARRTRPARPPRPVVRVPLPPPRPLRTVLPHDRSAAQRRPRVGRIRLHPPSRRHRRRFQEATAGHRLLAVRLLPRRLPAQRLRHRSHSRRARRLPFGGDSRGHRFPAGIDGVARLVRSGRPQGTRRCIRWHWQGIWRAGNRWPPLGAGRVGLDGHHLAGAGADLFTDRLVREAPFPGCAGAAARHEPRHRLNADAVAVPGTRAAARHGQTHSTWPPRKNARAAIVWFAGTALLFNVAAFILLEMDGSHYRDLEYGKRGQLKGASRGISGSAACARHRQFARLDGRSPCRVGRGSPQVARPCGSDPLQHVACRQRPADGTDGSAPRPRRRLPPRCRDSRILAAIPSRGRPLFRAGAASTMPASAIAIATWFAATFTSRTISNGKCSSTA